jgi:hypothetical protein
MKAGRREGRTGFVLACVAATSWLVACGARSSLEVGEAMGGAPARDAGPSETGVPMPEGGPPEAGPPDAPPASSCADAGATDIYLLTSQNDLWRFYPPSQAFTPIGPISCPGDSSSPFSMGVDRQGIGWAVFQSGALFRISMSDASCTDTPYLPGQLGWTTFGMAFTTVQGGTSEELFVAESTYQHPSLGLGSIDTANAALSFVAPFTPPLANAVELTGTGDGRLFAFSLDDPGPGSHIAQIDPSSGVLLTDVFLPNVGTSMSAFAFAFWGGDFYLFTAESPFTSSTVTLYHPADGTSTQLMTLNQGIVGAGVSTCAPQ